MKITTQRMKMPKELILSKFDASGIQIKWTPTAQRLDFFAWYDHYVGIEGDSYQLSEFFEKLGITEKDCKKAFAKKEKADA